jgi:two-component system, NtrC family, nitrogen regulation sensor histidine kinase NtrY
VATAVGLLWLGDFSPRLQWTASVALVAAWLGLAIALREQVVRPLGTLANMLAALKEGDFSIRARVGDAADALSLAYLEVNALEETLRNQRLGAVEATETLRKVLEEIDVAVFAFGPEGALRIVNRAGERLLGQSAERLIGRSAAELRWPTRWRAWRPARSRSHSREARGAGSSAAAWSGRRDIRCSSSRSRI